MKNNSQGIRILILEDSVFDAELAVRELRKAELDFVWTRVETRADFELAIATYHPNLILADYRLPDFNGARPLPLQGNAVRMSR